MGLTERQTDTDAINVPPELDVNDVSCPSKWRESMLRQTKKQLQVRVASDTQR